MFPYNYMMTGLIELVTSPGAKVDKVISKISEFLVDPDQRQNYAMIAQYFMRIRKSITGIEMVVPTALGKYPFQTYIPFLRHRDLYKGCDLEYLWPDFDGKIWSPRDMVNKPAIAGMIVSCHKEMMLIDKEAKYSIVIISGNMRYRLRPTKDILELAARQVISILEGAYNEEERTCAGPYCDECPANNSCDAKSSGIEDSSPNWVFKISNWQTGQTVGKNDGPITEE